MTIPHVYGETTIEAKPERVVTLGWMSHDTVAALDVVPVGVPESRGGDAAGYTEWFRDQVTEDLDGELPEILPVDGEGAYDPEQILALQPDLIVAPHSGITEVQYEQLAAIAPTVAYTEKPWFSGSWKDVTRLVASALGEADLAEARIADVEAAIEQEVAEHPDLRGSSTAAGLGTEAGATELYFYASGEPRVELLEQFGLVASPDLLSALGDLEGSTDGGISLERLDEVTADVYVAWSASAENTEATIEQELISRWDPVREGRYYVIEDLTLTRATTEPTLLSIPWAIEQGVAADLARAIGGTPVVRGQGASS